jgi:hypothetical protein
MHRKFVEDDQSIFDNEVNSSEGKEVNQGKRRPKSHVPPQATASNPPTNPLQPTHLLRDAVLALVKVGSSASSRSNAGQISSRVGTNLNDSGAARRGGADQVESAFCDNSWSVQTLVAKATIWLTY